MKHSLYLFSFFMLFGCTSKVVQKDIANLNGYWEIEHVTFPSGETKEFALNPSVDYIELDGLIGFRKKLQPKFDGSFITSNDAEPFQIKENNGQFFFHYKNEMSEWKEDIQSISSNHFSVVNQDNLTYFYKRFQLVTISE